MRKVDPDQPSANVNGRANERRLPRLLPEKPVAQSDASVCMSLFKPPLFSISLREGVIIAGGHPHGGKYDLLDKTEKSWIGFSFVGHRGLPARL